MVYLLDGTLVSCGCVCAAFSLSRQVQSVLICLVKSGRMLSEVIFLFLSERKKKYIYTPMGFPHGSDGKESPCNEGNLGSIPGLRRYPGEENGYSFPYSCLGKRSGQTTVYGVTEGQI